MPSPLPQKLAGLLVPVFAMRRTGDMGIGDTRAVLETLDFCAAHHFAVLQILPVHETVGDHSPYNPISSRAFSPALLTLEPEWVPGLEEETLQRLAPEAWLVQMREGPVKHHSIHSLKAQILMEAAAGFESGATPAEREDFENFQAQEAGWLPHYALFRTLVHEYDNQAHWEQWRPEHHTPASAETWMAAHPERERLERLRRAFTYIQWVAFRQWERVREHADAKGVKLMGEMSFGVSKSSADVWCQPELFDTDWSMGTRPVSYFDTNKDSERWGQNWGLPPYRWENHRSENFAWLRGRLALEARFFHLCRLDHLRGYFRAYMFPWQGGAQHAEYATLSEEEAMHKSNGRLPRFVPGPDEEETTAAMNDLQGRELITVMQEAAGPMRLVAELMGMMPDYMRQALEDLQMPNLTFPLLEKNDEGGLLTHGAYRPLSLVSYGNHDHAPLASVYARLRGSMEAGAAELPEDLRNLLAFAGWGQEPPDELSSELLSHLQRALFSTPCFLAVLMAPDLTGTDHRFNLPGSYGSMTWCERLELTWPEFERHSLYSARIAEAEKWILESGRASAALQGQG